MGIPRTYGMLAWLAVAGYYCQNIDHSEGSRRRIIYFAPVGLEKPAEIPQTITEAKTRGSNHYRDTVYKIAEIADVPVERS